MPLRVLAISAPQFVAGRVGARALSSADPVSLYNAIRLGAEAAAQKRGPWGDSNVAVSRDARRGATLLMNSLDELPTLEQRLLEIQPNLLLVGAMSICLPGAIACARRAKAVLGDRVCVVLGGRHANETVYHGPSGGIAHHPSSPLLLMAAGDIEPVFDVVVSGDGEAVVEALGHLVSSASGRGEGLAEVKRRLPEIADASGRWIAGTVLGGRIEHVQGRGALLAYDRLPSPASLFGIRTTFDVFGGRPTAQVFSDVGRGCVYDCQFCSEAIRITGRPAALDGSPDRLFRQVCSAVAVMEEEYPGRGASVFCEDSTLLTFAPDLVTRFVDRMAQARMDVALGGQLTIDQILLRPKLLALLRTVGLEYVFVGLETASPDLVGGMSKDIGRRFAPWLIRAEQALECLSRLGIKCGVALLFGLGESHKGRLQLAEQIARWQGEYGSPSPISLNWAVQHPLKGGDGGTAYRYTDWAVPKGPMLDLFCDFGEASLVYPIAGQPRPSLAEVSEVHAAFAALRHPPTASAIP